MCGGLADGICGRRAGRGAGRLQLREPLHELADGALHVVGLVAVCLRDREQQAREAGHAVAVLGRKVRATVERLAVRREEDRHRPAAVAGEHLHGVHVDVVDVRAFLAVDLDADEVLVHHPRDVGVLERLAFHDVAPVAGGVADAEQDRLVLAPGALERLGAPRVPVDRVVGVLAEIRARLVDQPVGLLRHSDSLCSLAHVAPDMAGGSAGSASRADRPAPLATIYVAVRRVNTSGEPEGAERGCVRPSSELCTDLTNSSIVTPCKKV